MDQGTDTVDQRVSVLIAGEEFAALADVPFVFGRTDGEGVVGLDPNDMGISAVAGSIEAAWGLWWLVNESTKRPLLIDYPGGPGPVRLSPGHRHALVSGQLNVLVPGAVYTHVVEIVLPATYAQGLSANPGRLTTGTITGAVVSLSDRERDALAGVFAGYLESFPHRREHPNTYEVAAALLGGEPASWSADRVRKSVERVKARFATKQSTYFEGPQANYDLAAHLLSTAVLSGEDLARLARRRP